MPMAACDEAPGPGSSSGALVQYSGAIFGGSYADDTHQFATVALVTRSGSTIVREAWCSGTLVAPDVVVTAAHCLDVAKGGKRFATIAPSSVAVFVGIDVQSDADGVFYGVSDTVIYPSYDRRQLSDDIAMLRLSSPAAAQVVSPLPPAKGITQGDVSNAASIEFAGFGETEVGYTDELLHADGVIGGLGCTVAGCYGQDDPATQFSYLQPAGGPCFGDSGGPAFLRRDGIWYLAGVTSWGGDNCAGPAAFGVSTRVDAFAGWISEFVGVSGPDCSADGVCNAACATGDDADCDTGPDCSADGVCNAACAAGDDADCDTGPDCSADGVCNAACASGDDADCDTGPDCSADGVCNAACAAGDDADCDAGPDCSADGVCNAACASGDDPDCAVSTCGDGLCGAGESCDGRGATQACGDCAGKTNGKPSRRFCEVEGVCAGPGC
ncbi:MAG: hypothetical protein ACI9MR_001061 [Myxococcota bacterium]|jgi:hypothetical protein